MESEYSIIQETSVNKVVSGITAQIQTIFGPADTNLHKIIPLYSTSEEPFCSIEVQHFTGSQGGVDLLFETTDVS